MLPQVIAGGGTPTPRNESAASPVMLAPIDERGQHQHRCHRVGQHVLGHDPAAAPAPAALRGLHVLGLAHSQHLAAQQPRERRPAGDPSASSTDGRARLRERRRSRAPSRKNGNARNQFVTIDQDSIGLAAHEPGDAADDDADHERHGGGQKRDRDRDPSADHQPAEDVAAEVVGAERMERAQARWRVIHRSRLQVDVYGSRAGRYGPIS